MVQNCDVREGLAYWPDEQFNCVVTSPPYWGLRDYGTAKWEGGDAGCDHRANGERRQLPHGDGRAHDSYADERHLIPGAGANFKDVCGKCGARRIDAQLGLERTPDEYVARLVEVFRDVKRTLRNDGVMWIVVGDSYAANRSYQIGSTKGGSKHAPAQSHQASNSVPPGLKPKDLVGIPWLLAFALRADGWYLRADCIWHKPNAMPSSQRDRPTVDYEHVFMFTKSEKYWYDGEAVKEVSVSNHSSGNKKRKIADGTDRSRLNTHLGSSIPWEDSGTGRSRRSVWSINTESYKGAHFATYPTALVEPLILSSCPIDGWILDPFAGSGTTLSVANRLGRNSVGIELNGEYVKMAEARIPTGK
jgi:DNA modification methylase